MANTQDPPTTEPVDGATPDTPAEPTGQPDAGRPGTPVGVLGLDWKMIAALIEERDGYEAAGNTERIKAVDKSFAAYGTTYARAKKALAERARAEADALALPPGQVDRNQKMIDALLDERDGYERAGKKERVAAVDESLKALGTTATKAAKERAARQGDPSTPPAGARRAGQQTRG